MANYFRLDVTFDTIAELGTTISFSTFPLSRNNPLQAATVSTVGKFAIGSTVEESAIGYYQSLVRDYGAFYTITSIGSTSVRIEGASYDEEVILFSFPSYTSYVYTPPVAPSPEFEITIIGAQAADNISNRNTHARFNITTDNGVAPYQINTPVSKSAPLETDLYVDYERQPTIYQDLNITDDNSDVAIKEMPTVDFFTFDSVNVLESGSGATVTAITTTQSGVLSTTKQYSLDEVTWQSGSSFTGILPGSYTMYVTDNLGASYSLPFTVVGVSVDKPEPYFNIPKANGFRFVQETTFDCDNVANWGNALLSELFDQGKFPNVERKCFNQPITNCDTIPTQIDTNYDNLAISVKDSNDVEVLTPSATLAKEYINQEDKRDCSFLQADDGKVVVVFGGGNTYTPDTTDITGTYQNFSGGLLEFSKHGKLFTISGTTDLNGDYEPIYDDNGNALTYYDSTQGLWGIKLDITFVSGNSSGICQTIYDELVYNIWELSTVGTALGSDIYKIFITATDDDPRYDTIIWKSEPIKKVSTNGTVLFNYSHKSNTAGIDFTTGIELKMRVPTRFIDGSTSEESQSFESDYGKKIIQKTIVTTSYNLETGLIPFYLVEKIAIASGMSDLYIDGVKYVKGEDSEAESLISQRNPFQKATRNYQLDDAIAIGEETGIVTTTKQVIGSSTVVAIGDNNA